MTTWFLGITICFAFAGSFVSAQGDEVDPVLRAKAQRALNNDQDLPPIPRGLMEPPPLPPPELHAHDIRKQRGSASASARRKTAPVKKTNAPQTAAKKAPTANAAAKKTNAPAVKTQSKNAPAKTTAKSSSASAPKVQSKNTPAKITKSVSARASTGVKKPKA